MKRTEDRGGNKNKPIRCARKKNRIEKGKARGRKLHGIVYRRRNGKSKKSGGCRSRWMRRWEGDARKRGRVTATYEQEQCSDVTGTGAQMQREGESPLADLHERISRGKGEIGIRDYTIQPPKKKEALKYF